MVHGCAKLGSGFLCRRLRRVADGFDAMAIRVENKRAVIRGVIASRSGLSVVLPTRRDRSRMECSDRRTVQCAKTQVTPARWNHGFRLLGYRELHANRARCVAIIGAVAIVKIHDAY